MRKKTPTFQRVYGNRVARPINKHSRSTENSQYIQQFNNVVLKRREEKRARKNISIDPEAANVKTQKGHLMPQGRNCTAINHERTEAEK